jgi:HAD superfamily hydrolase (TIGR01662 family)
MPIRAVLFDVGDTLWHGAAAPAAEFFRNTAAERAAEFLGVNELIHSDPAALARACWEALEDAMRTARDTDRVEPDYGVVGQRAALASGLEMTVEQAAGFMDAIYVSGAEGGKEAYPDARRTLDTLRERGFKLGIVTNRAFGGERFRNDLAEAGLAIGWDAMSVSVEVGYLKPHPALFRHALEELCIRPEDAVMVGNSLLEDVGGAQALGMRAAWKRSRPDAEGIDPDFAFDELTELLGWSLLAKECANG